MIKNIIFDMGGVIIDFDAKRSLRTHFKDEDIETVNQNVFLHSDWQEMDKGTHSVYEAVDKMCSRLPERLHAEVRSMVLEHEKEMPPIEAMYPVVEALKKNGYGIYLLSNCPGWFPEFKKSVPAFTFFDGFIISADYNEIKPGEEIYKILFREFSLEPEECYFIDDNMPNVVTSERLGMKAYCFADRDIEALKSDMRANGIEIN